MFCNFNKMKNFNLNALDVSDSCWSSWFKETHPCSSSTWIPTDWNLDGSSISWSSGPSTCSHTWHYKPANYILRSPACVLITMQKYKDHYILLICETFYIHVQLLRKYILINAIDSRFHYSFLQWYYTRDKETHHCPEVNKHIVSHIVAVGQKPIYQQVFNLFE